jgi:TIR domain
MIAVLSRASAQSENVKGLVRQALSQQKPVIPVMFEDCDVPFERGGIAFADFRTDYARGLQVLVHALAIPVLGDEETSQAAEGQQAAETAKARLDAATTGPENPPQAEWQKKPQWVQSSYSAPRGAST